jgi:iron complex outermembrane receptor protein
MYRSLKGFVALALLAPVTDAIADGKLDTVVVTGGRDTGVPANTPSPTFGISSEQLQSITVVNPEDALKYTPNIHVRKRFIGDNNGVVSVRSTSSRQSARTLVYADGLLLSNFLGSDFSFPPRWSLVTADEIRRVDVLYGPFSARFSGNSIGSTVLISTAMPEHFTVSGGVQYFTQSFDLYGQDQSYDGSLDRLDTQSQPLSYLTATRSAVAAGPSDVPIRGAVPFTDQLGKTGYILGVNGEGVADNVNDQIKLKVTYDIRPSLQVGFTAVDWRQESDNATGSFLRAADGSLVNAGNVSIDGNQYTLATNSFAASNGESHRRLYGLSFRSSHQTGWNYSIVASRFDTVRDVAHAANQSGAGPGTLAFADGSGWTVLDAQADYRPDERVGSHAIAFGLHADRYELDNETWNSTDWRSDAVSTFNNAFAGQTETAAAFVQDTWSFAEWWSLTPGIRFERWRATDGMRALGAVALRYPQRSDAYWSPKLSLRRQLSERWSARFSLGKAYRMPTVSELFQGRVTGAALVNNDPNLQPERSFSKDLTLESGGEKTSLRLSLYEDDIRDALFSQTNTTVFPSVTNIQNVDRVRTRGVELAVAGREWLLPKLDVEASVAWNHARTLENDPNPASVGRYFYRIPDWRADLVGSYRWARWLTSSLAVRYSGRQYNTLDNTDIHPDTFGGTSRFLVVDARVGFALGARSTLNVGVENLNDDRYFVYHPYPGRTYHAEARFRFD